MIKVKKAIIKEKLYFKKEDLISSKSDLKSEFTYLYGNEIFTTLEENDIYYIVPSGSLYKFEIEELEDSRPLLFLEKKLEFTGELRPDQKLLVNQFTNTRITKSGILQAVCGYGKSFAASAIIAEQNVKTLVLVHTKLLFKQWTEELRKLIPNATIGQIGDGIETTGDIVVCIYKSMINRLETYKNSFSLCLTDEAHLCPAETFSNVVNNLNCKIKIGISATPRRKDGKHLLLQDYFGDFHVIGKDSRPLPIPYIELVPTDIKFFIINPEREWTKQLNVLYGKHEFKNLIVKVALEKVHQGRCPLILAERVEFLKDLQQLIPNSVVLIGQTLESKRKDIIENTGKKYSCVLSTKLLDEGISIHRLDTLILTAPSSNYIKLEQRIGRIQREHPDKKHPLIVDIQLKGKIVENQQAKRLQWYQQRGYKHVE